MAENTLFQAPPGWLSSAVESLVAAGVEVVAPVREDEHVVSLAPISSAGQIAEDYLNVLVPLKRRFFPESEVLLEFARNENGGVELSAPPPLPTDPVVVLGARPCDAAALDALDRVFQWDYDDVRYRAQRERTTIVTFACAQPDETCLCTSVGGSPHGSLGSDVVAFPTDGGGALLAVHTDKGSALIERLGDTISPAPEGGRVPQPPAIEPRFDPAAVKAWLDGNFESDFWAAATLNCVGCGACSYACPTCHCFDIVDEATWSHGERRRNWDCCSFGLFTLHASGHNPRPDQPARYRQRVMHKFKYFPERFGTLACVGCGRCVRVCGVGQSLLRVLTDIEALEAAGEPSSV